MSHSKRKKIPLYNIEVDNVTMEEAIDTIIELALNENTHAYVVTPNVDHIVKLQNDLIFRDIYKNATLVLTDGVPLIWASYLFMNPIIEKVSGSDLFPLLCKKSAEKKIRLFFLGGQEGVAENAKKNLTNLFPSIQITGTYSPPFGFENDTLENQKIINLINNSKADILCVGLGAPKQEKWIYNNRHRLDSKVSLGIGASFDFVAGNIRRAPKWMQDTGLEWIFRTFQEPKRMFRRYFIEDLAFIPLTIKYLFKITQNKR